mgnify:CR=1 FL=1
MKNLFKKIIILGVIGLFIGTSAISSADLNLKKDEKFGLERPSILPYNLFINNNCCG